EQAEAEVVLSPKQIRFELGTLEGDIEETVYGRVLSFKGVPYMQAPIAQLRFKPPQELTAWEGVLEAKSFGPICPQKGSLVDESDWRDEDCLSLNMWLPMAGFDEDSDNKSDESINAPALDETNGKAVMVWIHGGGFIQGSGSFPLYYGARLASRGDVIVITFNYRLGVFGFLNTHRLAQGANESTSNEMTLLKAKEIGNFGLQDQIQALIWIQKYISAFGGDPNRITVFGESAGGSSICGLLASPLSKGLFQQAIIQSGGGCDGFKALNTEPDNELEIIASNILEALDCGDLSGEALHACLREKSTDEILESMESGGKNILGLVELGPSSDGILITGRADQILQDPEGDHPNIIIGSNADEMTLFTYNQPMSLSIFENFLAGGFGLLADRVFDLYPAENDQEARNSYNHLLADIIFVCPTLKFASSLMNVDSAYTGQVWVYHFMHSITSGVLATLGATHALEIPFVFNNHDVEIFGATATEEDRRLSDQMSDAWLNFAKQGRPNTRDLMWPSFRNSPNDINNDTAIDEGKVLLWKAAPEISSEPIRSARCSALDQLRLLSGI
ncbi:MAG: hypothetical protein CMH49_02215, partial [Myxococcales bacterium]|nr:hypothetical protein [Myxococcales bacterium]